MNKEKLTELVYINLGRASMCWSEIPKGVFDSTKAAELGKEIMEAIEKYVEEDKEPGWVDPMEELFDWEEAAEKYKKKVLKEFREEEEREESWMDEHKEKYDKLLSSGFFWEFHPELSGVWDRDKYAFCHDRKYKKNT